MARSNFPLALLGTLLLCFLVPQMLARIDDFLNIVLELLGQTFLPLQAGLDKSLLALAIQSPPRAGLRRASPQQSQTPQIRPRRKTDGLRMAARLEPTEKVVIGNCVAARRLNRSRCLLLRTPTSPTP